jgi:hypothetical protein
MHTPYLCIISKKGRLSNVMQACAECNFQIKYGLSAFQIKPRLQLLDVFALSMARAL